MRRLRFLLSTAAALPLALAAVPVTSAAPQSSPWLNRYEPNAASRKFPTGSAAERRARMHAAAYSHAYTRKFDLSGLPGYTPKSHPRGTIHLCGNNYIGDSPLGGWWKAAFAKYQPGIKLAYNLQTAANGISCLYEDRGEIGVDHEPLFYDDLANLRLKGFLPSGISVVTGAYDVIGWQNALAIIVNAANPVTGISMRQLDGIFGSRRAGGWVRTTWQPDLARGTDGDIRNWGQLGLKGEWASRTVDTFGFSLRYATAMEFSDDVLQASDKWNDNLLAFGNYKRADGSTYLESDQIVDHVAHDPGGIGYIRYHEDLPKTVKVLAIARSPDGPFVPLTMDSERDRTYPLWGQQSFWVEAKPGQPLDPKLYEFIRFVLSRQGQELVERDGKYLPLTARIAAEQTSRLDALEAGRSINGKAPGGN
ncbi:MAG TPA: substrate-binding domain-containing protein [Steroidobacteraceae bacterium]|jgi:phosphate transport system substrate-binding protein|nr:substrate-binding domain-containing protein [Steroidobacteraceae bacterium]